MERRFGMALRIRILSYIFLKRFFYRNTLVKGSLVKSTVNLKLAIGISGSGRTLQNLLTREKDGLGYQIMGVFSSKADAPGLDFAREFKLPIFINPFKSNDAALAESAAKLLYQWMEEVGANYVALAGFIRPFPIRSAWKNRVINIHPSLLPKFGGQGMYGIRVHQAVLAAGETTTGPTVHYVNEEYDQGTIIDQEPIPVYPGEDATSLAARVFEAECRLYPKVLQFLSGHIRSET